MKKLFTKVLSVMLALLLVAGLSPAVLMVFADEYDDAQTIAADAFDQATTNYENPAIFRFVPETSDVYRFYTENGMSALTLEVLNDTKVTIAKEKNNYRYDCEIKDLYLYGNTVYYIRIKTDYISNHTFGIYTETQHDYLYADADITSAPTCTAEGRANGVCRYCSTPGIAVIPKIAHSDSDGNGLCDACSKRMSYEITEGKTQSFLLYAGDMMKLYFTCPLTANYMIADNSGYKTRKVYDPDGNELDCVNDIYALTKDVRYCIIYQSGADFSDNEISSIIRHVHIDSGNGTCSICSAPLYSAITADTEYSFTSPAKDYVSLVFEPEQTGLYRFMLSSDWNCTYVQHSYDEDGNSITYQNNFMSLVKGKKYFITTYNHSASAENAKVFIGHKHLSSAENPDVCSVCGETFRIAVTEGVTTNLHLDPYEMKELVFDCETNGSYMMKTDYTDATLESPRDESDTYCLYYDGYYNFTAGSKYYYYVYTSSSTGGSVTYMLTHRHYSTGTDGACDICGKQMVHTVAEGELLETVIPNSDEIIVRFTPAETGSYKVYSNCSNCSLKGVYKKSGEFIAYFPTNITFEKDVTYDFLYSANSGYYGQLKFEIKHSHYSLDGDKKCDRCGAEYIFTLTEDETLTFTVPACETYIAEFTPAYTAPYYYNDSGAYCIGFINSYGANQGNNLSLEAGRKYTITASADRFKDEVTKLTASHMHTDNDSNGACDYCNKLSSVTLTENVPAEITMDPNDSLHLIFDCQRSGRYKFIYDGSLSFYGVYKEDGDPVPIRDGYVLESGQKYTATLRSYSSSFTGTVAVKHMHCDDDSNNKCDVCGITFSYPLTQDVKCTAQVPAGDRVEFTFTPEKGGNYLFNSKSSNMNVYDSDRVMISQSGYDSAAGKSYYYLRAGQTYIIPVENLYNGDNTITAEMTVTHSHHGEKETLIAPGVATYGIEKMTCDICGEAFYTNIDHTGSKIESGESDVFEYSVYEDGGIKEIGITYYSGDGEDIVIPSQINGIPVTAIEGILNPMLGKAVKSVVIPDTVREIHSGAFAASELTSVVIPDSVEIIQDEAFMFSNSLESVRMGSGIRFIGEHAFTTCYSEKDKAEMAEVIAEVREYYQIVLAEYSDLLGTEFTSFDELKAYAEENEIPAEYAEGIEETLNMVSSYDVLIAVYEKALANEESSLKEIIYKGTEQGWNNVVIVNDDGTISGAKMYYGGEKTFTATLYVDGEVYDTITFSETQESLNLPDVPKKPGYTGAWSDYILEAKDNEITAVYKQITYYATVTADGVEIDHIPFVYGQKSITLPDVPKKPGYTGSWPNYTLGDSDIEIAAVYEVNSYNVTFIFDEEVISQNTVEFGQAIPVPRLPEKAGYEFKGWSPKVPETMPASDVEFTAILEPITYTATFVADGVVAGTAEFTVLTQSITPPAVPPKEGYTGVWEDYTLGTKDITVNAIYTKNETPETENPTKNARISVKSDSVYKNSDVTVVATATGVPDGYILAVYDSGRIVARGDNTSVTYKVGEVSSSKTLTVKVIDEGETVQKDAGGNDLAANIEIKVKTGFFDIIIAFFKKLFRSNAVTLRP